MKEQQIDMTLSCSSLLCSADRGCWDGEVEKLVLVWNRLQGEVWTRQAQLSRGPDHLSLSEGVGVEGKGSYWTIPAHPLTDS